MPLLYEAVARIALDIDSTLHHYWDLLQRIARERYGVDLPYEEQRDWGITVLERDAIVHCVEETHSDENIAAGVPYPDAVETVRAWHEQGHWIHVTSHRRTSTYEATARWLERIGMPYDDLHCSFDKVTRCVELGIHVLVDDSPVNIAKARGGGHRAAPRIIHPWNEEILDARRRDRGSRLARAESGARAGAGPPRRRACLNRPRCRIHHAPHCRCASERPSTHGARARARSSRRTCPGWSPSAGSTTGGARSGSRASTTAPSSSSSTATGSAPRWRGSRTCRPPAARCSSRTTRARCRPTPR